MLQDQPGVSRRPGAWLQRHEMFWVQRKKVVLKTCARRAHQRRVTRRCQCPRTTRRSKDTTCNETATLSWHYKRMHCDTTLQMQPWTNGWRWVVWLTALLRCRTVQRVHANWQRLSKAHPVVKTLSGSSSLFARVVGMWRRANFRLDHCCNKLVLSHLVIIQ